MVFLRAIDFAAQCVQWGFGKYCSRTTTNTDKVMQQWGKMATTVFAPNGEKVPVVDGEHAKRGCWKCKIPVVVVLKDNGIQPGKPDLAVISRRAIPNFDYAHFGLVKTNNIWHDPGNPLFAPVVKLF